MTFIVIFVALLIERFFDWSHARRWDWFIHYQRFVVSRFPEKSSYLILAIVLIAVLLLVEIINLILNGWLYGLLALIFHIAILLYCLGPKNLWAETFYCINNLKENDRAAAYKHLQHFFGVSQEEPDDMNQQFIRAIFIASYQRIFAIMIWYAVFGVLGVVFYRMITLSANTIPQYPALPSLSAAARSIQTVLDWLPIRIYIFLFALGGHFINVLNFCLKNFLVALDSNEWLLVQSGMEALGITETTSLPDDGTPQKNAIQLIDRVLVITLIAIGLLVFLF